MWSDSALIGMCKPPNHQSDILNGPITLADRALDNRALANRALANKAMANPSPALTTGLTLRYIAHVNSFGKEDPVP